MVRLTETKISERFQFCSTSENWKYFVMHVFICSRATNSVALLPLISLQSLTLFESNLLLLSFQCDINLGHDSIHSLDRSCHVSRA